MIFDEINLIGHTLAHFRNLNTLRRIPFLKDWGEVTAYFQYITPSSIAQTHDRFMNSPKSPRLRRCRALFAALAFLPVATSSAVEIHLSPAGNDANPGTAALPVKTPQAAQARVRPLIKAGLSEPVEVIFAAGNYVMAAPLELRPEDSGTATASGPRPEKASGTPT